MPKKYGDYYTLEAFAQAYSEIDSEIKRLEVIKKDMSSQVKAMMEVGEELNFKGGHFTKYLIERKNYPVQVVVELLGRNRTLEFVKVDKARLDNYVNGQLSDASGKTKQKWAAVMAGLMGNMVVESSSEALRLVKK
jgi:hypothetical protein